MGAPKGNKNPTIGASFRDALRYEIAKVGRQIKEADPDQADDSAVVVVMRAIAAPLVEAATTNRDLSAVKEIADRTDGKSQQGVTLDGEVEQIHSGTVTFVGITE